MVDRIRWDTVSYLPFYYIFYEIDFQFLLLTIFNLQAKILAISTYSQTWLFIRGGHGLPVQAIIALYIYNQKSL